MNVEVDAATADDAQDIFDLRSDPRLAGMQYRPAWYETPNSLLAFAQPETEYPRPGMFCSIIRLDGEFAGHVNENYRWVKDRWEATLGWNLRPELWGNRIAICAMAQLFNRRFELQPTLQYWACSFKSNHRSIRVIQKLGFQLDRLAMTERFFHFCSTLGRYRVVKYGLTLDQWVVASGANRETGGF